MPCHVTKWVMVPVCRNRYGTDWPRTYLSEPRQVGQLGWIRPEPITSAGWQTSDSLGREQVICGLPVSHSNVLSKPGHSGLLVGFNLPGSHNSRWRTGSINTPHSRRPMMDREIAITLRSGIRGVKAGVGLSERVARQHAGLGCSSVVEVDGRGIRMEMQERPATTG